MGAAESIRFLVLFDGECALCNGWVKFVLQRDPEGRIHFAPLQGPTARHILSARQDAPAGLTTLILVEDAGAATERIRVRSDAALAVLGQLSGIWPVVGCLRIVPRAIRDLVYDFVARHRYQWFGKEESCLLPSQGTRGRLHP